MTRNFALRQFLQRVGNLRLQRAAPASSHERNLICKVEHPSGQMSDLCIPEAAAATVPIQGQPPAKSGPLRPAYTRS